MLKVKTIIATISMTALIAVGSAAILLGKANSDLRHELRMIEDRFLAMAEEHNKAITAANEALKLREEINDLFLQKALGLENELNACPDFGSIAIPESIRLRLKGHPANSASNAQNPNEPACSDKASQQGQARYGW